MRKKWKKVKIEKNIEFTIKRKSKTSQIEDNENK